VPAFEVNQCLSLELGIELEQFLGGLLGDLGATGVRGSRRDDRLRNDPVVGVDLQRRGQRFGKTLLAQVRYSVRDVVQRRRHLR